MSNITAAMLERLSGRFEVHTFDLTPSRRIPQSWRTLRFLASAGGAFVRLGKYIGISAIAPRACMYIALSAGWRQALELIYICTARLLRQRIYVHHHSFAYLSSPGALAYVAMRTLRDARHIVLCPAMGQRIVDSFGISNDHIRLLSNVAYLSPGHWSSSCSRDCLRVGFMSNITPAKGIFTFLDIMGTCHAENAQIFGLVAGPVDPMITEVFHCRIDLSAAVEYRGPVYGPAKDTFFDDIDLFLFPSTYVNEAEPIVVLEALRAGVPVISTARGCVSTILSDGGGWAVSDGIAFDTFARSTILRLAQDRIALAEAKVSARRRFDELFKRESFRLDHLLSEISLGMVHNDRCPDDGSM